MTAETLVPANNEASRPIENKSVEIAQEMFEITGNTDDPVLLESMQRAAVMISEAGGDVRGESLALSELETLGLRGLDAESRDIIHRLSVEVRLKEGRLALPFEAAATSYLETYAQMDGASEVASRLAEAPTIEDCGAVLVRIEEALASLEEAARKVPGTRTELFREEIITLRSMRDSFYEKAQQLTIDNAKTGEQVAQDAAEAERLSNARKAVANIGEGMPVVDPTIEGENARLAGIIARVQNHLRDSVVGELSFVRNMDAQTLHVFNEGLWKLHKDSQKESKEVYRERLKVYADSFRSQNK